LKCECCACGYIARVSQKWLSCSGSSICRPSGSPSWRLKGIKLRCSAARHRIADQRRQQTIAARRSDAGGGLSGPGSSLIHQKGARVVFNTPGRDASGLSHPSFPYGIAQRAVAAPTPVPACHRTSKALRDNARDRSASSGLSARPDLAGRAHRADQVRRSLP